MSDFFKDKVMSELESSEEGWLTLAIQPYTYSLLDKIEESDFPEEHELTYEDVLEAGDRYLSVRPKAVIEMLLKRHNISDLTFEDIEPTLTFKNHECIQVKTGTTVDLKTKTLNGGIKFTRPELNESNLSEFVVYMVSKKFNNAWNIEATDDIGHLNGLMDLLECKEERKCRSRNKKMREIKRRFREIIEKDEWKIRNCDLIIKSASWLLAAVSGNIHALANITKLKCMTHSGKIIYSMEEIN